MADTVTPKMGLTKPEIGASPDTWGNKLNANMDILDQKVVRNNDRWNLDLGDSGAGNPDGHMVFTRYNPVGVVIDQPFYMNRLNGDATFTKNISLGSGLYGAPWQPYQATPAAPPAGTGRIFFDTYGNPIVQRPDGTLQYLGVPPGHIMYTGGVIIEQGWALCNGQAVSRAANPIVFNRYGGIYGAGNGSTTFNLPDVRGRVIASSDDGAGRLPGYSLSVAGGLYYHGLSIAEMPGHGHHIDFFSQGNFESLYHGHTIPDVFEPDSPQNNSAAAGSGPVVRGRSPRNYGNTGNTDLVHTHQIYGDTQGAGSWQGHNNIQPTITFYAVIKLG